MKKKYKIPIIVAIVIFGIPLAWYLETLISLEILSQNFIKVEKRSPPIEIRGTIDFQPAHSDFFLEPNPDEMYKIEQTGKDKAYLVNSFIDPSKGKIPREFDEKKVEIKGVLVNDDPDYGKPEKTYDAIIIVQEVKVLG